MKEVENRILYSEMQHITEPEDLKDMMMKVFREGLEGLVLKDVMVCKFIYYYKMLTSEIQICCEV